MSKAFYVEWCKVKDGEIAELEAKRDSLQVRLEVAEGLLNEIASRAYHDGTIGVNFCRECDCEWGYGHKLDCLVGKVQDFLTPTPPDAPAAQVVNLRGAMPLPAPKMPGGLSESIECAVGKPGSS